MLFTTLCVTPYRHWIFTAYGIEESTAILLFVVGEQIVECKTIMYGDKVHRVIGLSIVPSIESRRTCKDLTSIHHSIPVISNAFIGVENVFIAVGK